MVPPALDLLEEAVRMLRADPAFVLTHWAGSLPFVVALLYFWADMSRGAFAAERCAPGALGLGILFLWMKVFHAVSCVQMAERLYGTQPGSRAWTGRRIFRLVSVQAAVQPAGLVVLGLPVVAALAPALAREEPALAVALMLVGAVLGLALGWTYAFFQGATVVADRSDGVAWRAVREAGRAAWRWPFQNHGGLALLGLFGFFVFVNVVVGLVAAPWLLKLVTGVESEFTLTQWSVFNTTFFSAAAGIAWLLLDPVAKAFYVLRHFHGEAVKSGADIRARLRGVSRAAAGAAALLVLAVGTVLGAGEIRGAEDGSREFANANAGGASARGANHPAVAPESLSGAIDEVMARRIYTWREPRERARPGEPLNTDWLTRAMKSFGESLDGVLRKVARSIFDFVDWILLRRLRMPRGSGNPGQFDWTSGLDVLLYALLAAAVGFLLYQGFRVWRGGRTVTVVATEALPVVPDLRDENVAADQLPEDGWLGMARDLAARGELRLALRALYLASLAGLARREFVTIARHKTNRDYSREVERRARALPELQGAFGEIVRSFDAAWYGTHAVTPELLERVEAEVRTRIATTS